MGFLGLTFMEYEALSGKYGGFKSPVMQLSIGDGMASVSPGALSGASGLLTDGVSITLNRNSSSSASFNLVNSYSPVFQAFDRKITPGMPFSISLGYGNLVKSMFKGYVEKVTYNFADTPSIRVEAYDIVKLMMESGEKNITWEAGGVYSDTIKEIMKKYSACSFPVSNILPTLSKHGQLNQGTDDYKFIKEYLCKYSDRDFIVAGGSAYLVDAYLKMGKLTTLGYGKGIKSISMSSSYKNIEANVTGDKLNSASGSYSGNAGFSLSGKKETRNVTAPLKTSTECSTYAKRIVMDEIHKSKMISVNCIGIPDIIPGVGVGISGIDLAWSSDVFYVDTVTHTLNSSGYSMSFTAYGG